MSVGQAALAFVLGALAASLADWLFMAVLFHEKYKAFPEIWRRPRGGAGEGKAIGLSAVAALLTPGAFVLCSHLLGVATWRGAVSLALAAWLMGPVPILLGNYLFIKLHPAILTAHLVGWLVKLLALAAILGVLIA